MKKILLISLMSALISACASNVASRDTLLSSIKIGVLENTRLAYWQNGVVGTTMSETDVQYLSYEELRAQVIAGNLDIVIGLPATDHLLQEGYWSTNPVETREFNFHFRASDPRGLGKYSHFASFARQLNYVGYVSEGEAGIVNREMIKQSKLAGKLTACGDMESCINQLENGKLDTLFADVKLLNTHLKETASATGQFTTSRFTHKQPFTLMVNQKTLTRAEFNQLNNMLR